MTISVLLADGHPLFRQGLDRLFADDERFFPIFGAGNGEEALACVRASQPDVAILGWALPERGGIEVSAMARDESLTTRCIILTLGDSLSDARRIFLSGAKGYLSRKAGFEELAALAASVAAGESGLTSLDFMPTLEDLDALGARHGLSRREVQILCLVGRGLTSKEIAEALYISSRTVDSHRMRIMDKLEIRNGPGLVKFAMENRVI
jgi:DNA-binding NarL/FixJ family response regulator